MNITDMVHTMQSCSIGKQCCESTSMVAVRLEDFQPDIVINDGIKAITGTNKACPGTVNFR